MSFTPLPLIEIAPPPPASILIDAGWLHAQIAASYQRQQANHLAVNILNAARRKAEKVMRDVYRWQRQQEADMDIKMARLRKTTLEQTEAEWISAHVTYLLDGEEQHQQWVDDVANSVQNSIEKVLTRWFDEQPRDPTLCHRLAKQAQQMAKEGTLTLRAHPSQLEQLGEAFGERFTLVAEPIFAVDQVELSSARLSVEFSLSRHFQQLLAWLRQSASPPGGFHGE